VRANDSEWAWVQRVAALKLELNQADAIKAVSQAAFCCESSVSLVVPQAYDGKTK
jgi:hypothetical protein